MDFKRILDNRMNLRGNLEEVYDEIRMRDAEGHPLTYIEYGNLIIEFKRASLRKDHIDADVRITIG